MRATSFVTTMILLGVFGLAVGCGEETTGSGAPLSGKAPSADDAKAWPQFDPPTRFDPARGVELPAGTVATNVALHGTTAFVGLDDGLLSVDLTTGKHRALVRSERAAVKDHESVEGMHTPVLAELAGRPVVLLPLLVTVPAVGTSPASREIDLLVADAATGARISVVQVDLADDDTDNRSVAGTQVRVVGVRPGLVVLSTGERVCLLVDLTAGTVVWRRQNFRTAAVVGDTVMGVRSLDVFEEEAAGLALADGQERWKTLSGSILLELHAAGPNFVVATNLSSIDPFFVVVRSDGSLVGRNKGSFRDMVCRYDEVSVTVCANSDGRYAFALDSTSNAVLWAMPEEGSRRVTPIVTAVWHGAVYGWANDAPVVLDAKTGADREPSPGVAAAAVNAYAAVGARRGGGPARPVLVHPATG